MEISGLTVFAARFAIGFAQPRPAGALKSLVEELMSAVARECVAAGAGLIGHIKCIAEVPDGGHIACSVLDADGRVACTGEFSGASPTVVVVQNILLYGLGEERVRESLFKVLDREVTAAGGRWETKR